MRFSHRHRSRSYDRSGYDRQWQFDDHHHESNVGTPMAAPSRSMAEPGRPPFRSRKPRPLSATTVSSKSLDANGASTTAAGTITTVTLDGLSHPVTATFTSSGAGIGGDRNDTQYDHGQCADHPHHQQVIGGAAVSIIDNLTTPTATTLTLKLLADGVATTGFALAAAFPASSLVLVDTKNEISTIHLTLGYPEFVPDSCSTMA